MNTAHKMRPILLRNLSFDPVMIALEVDALSSLALLYYV